LHYLQRQTPNKEALGAAKIRLLNDTRGVLYLRQVHLAESPSQAAADSSDAKKGFVVVVKADEMCLHLLENVALDTRFSPVLLDSLLQLTSLGFARVL
jgi:hypothetical protein